MEHFLLQHNGGTRMVNVCQIKKKGQIKWAYDCIFVRKLRVHLLFHKAQLYDNVCI